MPGMPPSATVASSAQALFAFRFQTVCFAPPLRLQKETMDASKSRCDGGRSAVADSPVAECTSSDSGVRAPPVERGPLMLHEVGEVLMAKFGTTLVEGRQMGSIDMYEEVYLIRQ